MKKGEMGRGVVFLALLLTIFCSSNVLAASDNQTAINKAFSCLQSEIGNKSSLTLDQAIFAAMAIGSNSKIDNELNSEKNSKACWPKSNCLLKESSQVALALDRRGADTRGVVDWIISKNATPSELIWYLEIDSQDHTPAVCSVSYDSREREVAIGGDLTILRNTATDCLSISDRGYWLKISPSCLSKQFKISCDKDFVSSLLYQKKDGSTVYVSSESHQAASNSSTTEQVKVLCLADSGSCNYEGTLWAVFALNKIGKDVNPYMPYLVALADDNIKYFPSAFLYTLVGKDAGSDEYYNTIIQKQMKSGFWEISGSRYGKYYDSSLAMLGLGGKSSTEVDNFKEALYEAQNSKGCWSAVDPIKDTSFILYSVWNQMINSGSGGSGGGGSEPRCESKSGQSCQVRADCTSAGGDELAGFLCSSGEICCSAEIALKSCSSENGEICAGDEECDENVVSSSDGSCCLGNCQKIEIQNSTDDTCTLSGGECKSSCSSGEKEDQSKECTDIGVVCCIKQGGGGISWWLILLLILLIALVVAAIIYRDKLRVWWYSRRGKASVSPMIKPGVPPFGSEPRPNMAQGQRPQRPMQMPPRSSPRTAPTAGVMQPPRRNTSQRDKDMEETLKKLKEISE